ncbi:flavodoxin [Lysobacteraceae bacterium NML91-0213]|nr:flavodoxin [Xanthomonadaceae bacterium NML91-0213]
MRILLAHTSLSGNTRDVAHAIRAHCEASAHAVTWVDVDTRTLAQDCPHVAGHHLYVLGSWSINAGRTPPEMKRFIADLVDAVGKPEHVAVFGTGETQWGEEHYCGAVRRIARFFDSPYPRLEIEQMPHGHRDAARIRAWTDHILTSVGTLHEDDQRHLAR